MLSNVKFGDNCITRDGKRAVISCIVNDMVYYMIESDVVQFRSCSMQGLINEDHEDPLDIVGVLIPIEDIQKEMRQQGIHINVMEYTDNNEWFFEYLVMDSNGQTRFYQNKFTNYEDALQYAISRAQTLTEIKWL